MHIHGVSNQFAALMPTQLAQQATATSRAAAEVRRKLAGVANADAVSSVEGYTQRGRRQNQPDEEEAFRKVFLSVQA